VSWFTKPVGAPNATTTRAKKWVERLPTSEILMWADTAGAGISRALSDFQREGNRDSLEDAYTGILTMLGVVEELRDRS